MSLEKSDQHSVMNLKTGEVKLMSTKEIKKHFKNIPSYFYQKPANPEKVREQISKAFEEDYHVFLENLQGRATADQVIAYFNFPSFREKLKFCWTLLFSK